MKFKRRLPIGILACFPLYFKNCKIVHDCKKWRQLLEDDDFPKCVDGGCVNVFKKKKLPEVAKMFHRTFVLLLESSHQRRECHIAIVSDLPCSQGTW